MSARWNVRTTKSYKYVSNGRLLHYFSHNIFLFAVWTCFLCTCVACYVSFSPNFVFDVIHMYYKILQMFVCQNATRHDSSPADLNFKCGAHTPSSNDYIFTSTAMESPLNCQLTVPVIRRTVTVRSMSTIFCATYLRIVGRLEPWNSSGRGRPNWLKEAVAKIPRAL